MAKTDAGRQRIENAKKRARENADVMVDDRPDPSNELPAGEAAGAPMETSEKRKLESEQGSRTKAKVQVPKRSRETDDTEEEAARIHRDSGDSPGSGVQESRSSGSAGPGSDGQDAQAAATASNSRMHVRVSTCVCSHMRLCLCSHMRLWHVHVLIHACMHMYMHVRICAEHMVLKSTTFR